MPQRTNPPEKEPSLEARTERKTQAIMIAALAAIAVVVAIVVSQGGDDEPQDGGTPPGAAALEDLNQEGFSVGEPGAPLTLTEYGDLQCPFCAEAAHAVIPVLLDEYVASGDLRIDFKPLAFLGPDSETAALVAIAAAEQDLGFAFVDAFYANQGAENSGYVTPDFLREVGGEVEGLDVEAALADAEKPQTADALAGFAAEAEEAGVDSTPTFLLGPTGEAGEPVDGSPSDPEPFREAIEAALAQ
jgi:protein-disulfide isomerase